MGVQGVRAMPGAVAAEEDEVQHTIVIHPVLHPRRQPAAAALAAHRARPDRYWGLGVRVWGRFKKDAFQLKKLGSKMRLVTWQ